MNRMNTLYGRFYFKFIYRGRFLVKIIWILKILLSQIVYFFSPNKASEKIWLIGTGDDRFENNARAFYEYLEKEHDEISLYWIAKNISSIPINGKVIKKGSIKNYVLLQKAEVGFFSHSDSDIGPGFFRIVNNRKIVLVLLDHGFASIKKMKDDYYKGMRYDMICSASKFEKNIKVRTGLKEKKVIITGFARCDNFMISENNNCVSKILFMPTWRNWYIDGNKDYTNNNTYKVYCQLFNDDSFRRMCEENNITVTFILHPTFEMYFRIDNDLLKKHFGNWVNVIANRGDIRDSMNDSDLFITDYSSMCFDFVYMNKKILLYWFDEEEYREKVGIEDIDDKLNNIICRNISELEEKILRLLVDKQLEIKEMSEYFYMYHDKKNCERIYMNVLDIINNE